MPETCETCLYCEPDEDFVSLFGDCKVKRKYVALKSLCSGWRPKIKDS